MDCRGRIGSLRSAQFRHGLSRRCLARVPQTSTASTCTLGETAGFPKTTVIVDLFPVLSVYELFDASQCTACGGQPVALNSVSWQFTYAAQVPCPIAFEVREPVLGDDGGQGRLSTVARRDCGRSIPCPNRGELPNSRDEARQSLEPASKLDELW